MATPKTVYTAKRCVLGQTLQSGGSDTSIIIYADEAPLFTTGVVKWTVGEVEEWTSFTGVTSNGGTKYTLTGVVRGLDKDATSYSDNTTSNAKDFPSGTPGIFVLHSVDVNTFAQTDADETISGDWDITGTLSFGSTTVAGLVLQNVTTAQRTALIGVTNGAIVFDTTIGVPYIYAGGTWLPITTGTTPDEATETSAGTGELGTVAEQIAATDTRLVQTKYIIGSSAGAADAGKLVHTNVNGVFDESVLPSSATKFGGDGSDGAISGALTITGSNNTYIVKNYSSFTPGANTVTVTPTGCIVHIKVSGDCDLTGSTLDFSGKGVAGGAGGATHTGSGGTGNIGTVGTSVTTSFIGSIAGGSPGTGGTFAGSAGTGGTAGSVSVPITGTYIQGNRAIIVSPGAGGGGGAGGIHSNSGQSGAGGDGGDGGGCLILEVAGDLTFSSTTITVAGDNGNNGDDGIENGDSTADASGGGGGGGGGGGVLLCIYGGTLTGSATPTVSGGTGGSAGASNTDDGAAVRGAGGGGGGASRLNNGSAGSNGVGETSGAGGNGADGWYLIEQNKVFV